MAWWRSGTGPLDMGSDAEAPIMEVNARVKVELSDVARIAASSLAEAIGRMAREGFVRSFEPAGFLLWCPSCETSFDPRELVVRVVVAVGDAMVLGLYDPATGARGIWVLTERSERDAWLLTRLVRSPDSCATRCDATTRCRQRRSPVCGRSTAAAPRTWSTT